MKDSEISKMIFFFMSKVNVIDTQVIVVKKKKKGSRD